MKKVVSLSSDGKIMEEICEFPLFVQYFRDILYIEKNFLAYTALFSYTHILM